MSYDESVHRPPRSLQVMSVVNRSFESAGFSEYGVRKLPRTGPSPLIGRQQAMDQQLKQITKIKNKPQQGYSSKTPQPFQQQDWYEDDHQHYCMTDCTDSRIEMMDEGEEQANCQLPSSPPTQPMHQNPLQTMQCASDSWCAETRCLQPPSTSLWPFYSTYQAHCQTTAAQGSEVTASTAVTSLYEDLFRGI